MKLTRVRVINIEVDIGDATHTKLTRPKKVNAWNECFVQILRLEHQKQERTQTNQTTFFLTGFFCKHLKIMLAIWNPTPFIHTSDEYMSIRPSFAHQFSHRAIEINRLITKIKATRAKQSSFLVAQFAEGYHTRKFIKFLCLTINFGERNIAIYSMSLRYIYICIRKNGIVHSIPSLKMCTRQKGNMI